jgi:predicted permease
MQDILIQAVCYVSIIILGHTLRKRGFFGKEVFPVLASITLKITLPAAIIASANGKTIDAAMLLLPVLGFGCGVLYILAAIALHRRASKEQRAFAILNLPGYSIGSFAMPFPQGFLGPVAVLATSLFDIGNAFICLGTTLAIAITVKAGEGFQWRRIFQSLSRSVAFLTYLVMTLLALIGWELPSPVISSFAL